MTISFEKAHELASAAFENYTIPEGIIIDETSGFSSETSAKQVEFSKPVFYYGEEDAHLLDNDNFNTSTAFFNIKVNLETAEITDAYLITQSGGNIVGEFTDENRRETYEAAGMTEFLPSNDAPKI